MRYYFNTLFKMDFEEVRVSNILRLFKFHYQKGNLIKKEYKYLVKSIYKNKNKNKKRRKFID